MNWLIFIETLSNFSFIFAFFNFIFIFFYNINTTLNIAFFLLTIFLVSISQLLKCKFKTNKKISYIALLFLFFPIIFVRNTNIILFLSAVFIYSIFYMLKNIDYLDYNDYACNFENHFYVIIFIVLICLFNNKISTVKNIVMLYLVLYLILSAVVMRTLRNIEYNINSKKINKLTFKYTVFGVMLVFIFSLFNVKKIIIFSYTKFIDTICNSWLFKHILLSVANLFYIPIKKFLFMILDEFGRLTPNTEDAPIDSPIKKVPLSTPAPINEHFILTAKIVIVILVLFIIIKLMKRNTKKSSQKYYTESNEFILPKNTIFNNFKKNIINKLKFKNYNEIIRNYYKKYLKLCLKKDITLSKNNTSYDVYKKSHSSFNEESINNIRKIYIKIRYSNFKCDKTTFKKFKNNYTKISK